MEPISKDYTPSAASLSLYDDFLAQTGPDRLQKLLARYELFKMAMEVPGDIVECGVFKGSGLYTLAKYRQIFKPNNEQKVIGFDFFEADRAMEFRSKDDDKVLKDHATRWSGRDLILKNMAAMGIHNVELVAGNVIETTKAYAENNLGFRISLLYLDVDNYEGTLAILNNFYRLVSPGGVIAFDEYAYRTYGESDAVDEFFKGKPFKLRSFPWANTPTAYLVKEIY